MDKEAQEALEGARSALSGAADTAGDKISDFIEGVKPFAEKHKSHLLATLIGAILGGGAAGLGGESVLGGAALGGAAGGATSLGYDYLTGKTTLPGMEEEPRSLLERGADAATIGAAKNIGAIGGAGLGAYGIRNALPTEFALRRYIREGIPTLTKKLQGDLEHELAEGEQLTRRSPTVKTGPKYTATTPVTLQDTARRMRELTGRGGPHWGYLAAPAAGLVGGHLLDRYIRGDY